MTFIANENDKPTSTSRCLAVTARRSSLKRLNLRAPGPRAQQGGDQRGQARRASHPSFDKVVAAVSVSSTSHTTKQRAYAKNQIELLLC